MSAHCFSDSLAASHAAEDLPFWEECYRAAFPTMRAMVNHREDGQHQRNGIDRSIMLANAKPIFIDEKVRGRNKKTGKVYTDIALEYLSDRDRGDPGWVCKPLWADYIAYAIAPRGKCYLLPVLQLQEAWRRNHEAWRRAADHSGRVLHPVIEAHNEWNGRRWTTVSLCVPPEVLFPAIGNCLRLTFAPIEIEE